ncbi:MAG: hypothetical protein R6V67_00750 [Spirochaetia bacterium]
MSENLFLGIGEEDLVEGRLDLFELFTPADEVSLLLFSIALFIHFAKKEKKKRVLLILRVENDIVSLGVMYNETC